MKSSLASPQALKSRLSKINVGSPGKQKVQKMLLACGILSSFLYVSVTIILGLLDNGYSSFFQTVSELSAIGAPTRPVWVPFGYAFSLLIAAFGWGVWTAAGRNWLLQVAGVLLIGYGMIGLAWPPMHQRQVLAAGGKTMTDTMHIGFTIVTSLLLILTMGFCAAALGKSFRRYSIATILVLLVFGTAAAMDAPKLEANLPTPWMGVWERINIFATMLWLIVLATILLGREKIKGVNSR